MTDPGQPGAVAATRSLRDWLGLNRSTMALLGAIFLVTASTELWSPLIPQYLKSLRSRAATGEAWVILMIGAYGFYRDGLEAVYYFAGGAIAGRFNTRRSLLLFNLLPLLGLAILSLWNSTWGVFVAVPFIFAWNSIAGPATIRVVGDSLSSDRRAMAFTLQSVFKRLARIGAYGISALVVLAFGEINGVRVDAAVAVGFVVAAAAIQFRFMRTASADPVMMLARPRRLYSQFDKNLKRLLIADVFSRWAEGMAGPFVILYCVPILSSSVAAGTAAYQSLLLNIQAVTSLVFYLLIGPLASREGLAKKPYIGLTFLFFALFPLSLIVLGPSLGVIGLALAFVIGGLREIGEPARKAMIADLVPSDARTQAVGLYWSARSVAVMCASPVGALLWILGEKIRPSFGPVLAFGAAGLLGLVGAGLFYARFGKSPSG